MERKYVVELQAPLFEPQLSRVAAEVAGELAISEVKLGALLSRGVGPLTKPVDKPVAEKVAAILRAAGGDVAVVEDAPTPAPVADTLEPTASSPTHLNATSSEESDFEEDEVGVPPGASEASKRRPWLLPVVLLGIVALAFAVYFWL